MPNDDLMDRRVRFEFDETFASVWTPDRPEFSCVANGVSLLMPHLEPFVARAVNADAHRSDATVAFARQEMQHFRQHEALNRLIIDRHRHAGRVDRIMAATFRWLSGRSDPFRLAFSVGAETIAYHSARWTQRRRQDLFAKADPVAATLFLWHFAEEIEHKAVAHDAAVTAGVSNRTMFAGRVTALVVMGALIVASTLVMLAANRRLRRPICHLRMASWSISFAFELLPQFAASLLPGHDPRSLADPTWYTTWLEQYDPDDGTLPRWDAGLNAAGRPDSLVSVG